MVPLYHKNFRGKPPLHPHRAIQSVIFSFMSPLPWIIDPRYLKLSLLVILYIIIRNTYLASNRKRLIHKIFSIQLENLYTSFSILIDKIKLRRKKLISIYLLGKVVLIEKKHGYSSLKVIFLGIECV